MNIITSFSTIFVKAWYYYIQLITSGDLGTLLFGYALPFILLAILVNIIYRFFKPKLIQTNDEEEKEDDDEPVTERTALSDHPVNT